MFSWRQPRCSSLAHGSISIACELKTIAGSIARTGRAADCQERLRPLPASERAGAASGLNPERRHAVLFAAVSSVLCRSGPDLLDAALGTSARVPAAGCQFLLLCELERVAGSHYLRLVDT